MIEVIIFIGVGVLLLFLANFFLELGVSIILSAIIFFVSSIIVFGGYGTGLFTGDKGLFDEPLYAISLIGSAVAVFQFTVEVCIELCNSPAKRVHGG